MIEFKSSLPQQLLSNIKKAIDAGTIATWKYDSDGDFTHTPDQWRSKAWLRPQVINGVLRFTILIPASTLRSCEVYAVYHGRFIEMMLAHFDKSFDNVAASALLSAPDAIAA
jgi:hypothetical protein